MNGLCIGCIAAVTHFIQRYTAFFYTADYTTGGRYGKIESRRSDVISVHGGRKYVDKTYWGGKSRGVWPRDATCEQVREQKTSRV